MLAMALTLSGVIYEEETVYASANSDYVYQFLISELGLNSAAACGVLANIEKESDFNPCLSVLDTNGKYTLGICQWNGGRKTALENYAGNLATTLEWQLKFLKYELSTSEKNAWYNMNLGNIPNTKEGAGEAARRWAKYFERCAAYYCPVEKTGSMYANCSSCRYQYGERVEVAISKYWLMYGDGSNYSSGDLSDPTASNGTSGGTSKSALKKAQNDKNNQNQSSSAEFGSWFSYDNEVVVATTKPAYTPDEKVTVVRNALTDCKNYTLEIYQDEELVLSQDMKEATATLDPMEEGKYQVYVKYGKSGETQTSEAYAFTVQKEVIGVAAISSEKSYYKYGESVTLTRSDVSNTSYYWITIIRDGKEIVSELMKGDSYEIKHAIAGEYQVYLEVGNVVSGQVTSEPYKFTVAEHDHVWKSKVIKEATATENGLIKYSCSCLLSYTEEIPATGK